MVDESGLNQNQEKVQHSTLLYQLEPKILLIDLIRH